MKRLTKESEINLIAVEFNRDDSCNKIELRECETIKISRNEEAKKKMAISLMEQGLSEKAVCRLLHIDPELVPDRD